MMALPIVLIEGHDVSLHDSAADAERQLEAVDVRNGVYSAYDADGRRLRLETAWEKKPAFFGLIGVSTEIVRITEAAADSGHHDELHDTLIAALVAAGSNPDGLERLTNRELIRRLHESRKRH